MVNNKTNNLMNGSMQMSEVSTTGDELIKYKNYNVYYKQGDKFRLYKSKDVNFDLKKVKSGAFPKKLFVSHSDKTKLIKLEQHILNTDLKKSLKVDIVESRRILNRLIEISLEEPRSEVLFGIKVIIEEIVEDFLMDPEIVEQLTFVAVHDYTTQLHQTNTMLLSIGYAHYSNFNQNDIKLFALM